jgi:hypothetical protein
MRSFVAKILSVALAITATACTEDDLDPVVVPRDCSSVMLDSLGVEYPINRSRGCMPGVDEHSPVGVRSDGTCGGESTPTMSFFWGRFFGVCSACDNGSLSHLCRPLICEIDEDCPMFENIRLGHDGARETFIEEFECRNGVCQSADLESHPPEALYRPEAEMLCMAPIERHELYDGPDPCPGVGPTSDAWCPQPLPAGCLQP